MSEVIRKPKSARTLRAEKRKELKTTVVKCTLYRVCKNERMLSLINDEMVPTYTHLTVLVSNFLSYFVTRELSLSHELPEIDENFVGYVIRLCANLKDDRDSRYANLNETRAEFKKLIPDDYPLIDRAGKIWLSKLIDELKIQFYTCIKNSNTTRFYNKVRKWAFWKSDKRITNDDFKQIWELFRKDKENTLSNWDSADILEDIRSKMPKFSFKLKDRLPLMYYILQYYEFNNTLHSGDPYSQVKLFSLLPIYTWDAKYIPITNTVLKSMILTLERDTLLKGELDLLAYYDELWEDTSILGKLLPDRKSSIVEL